MAVRARDVMQTSVVTVAPEAPLAGVAQLFVEEGIHGAPVVDETGRLVGVVSIVDLLRAVEEEHDQPANATFYYRDLLEYSTPDWSRLPQDFQDRLEQVRVSDVMQPSVVTVSEDTTIPEVAKLMRANTIHRVIVTRGETLVGLVTALDLVGLLEG
jgi:CBS domain-containing protein